MEHRIAIITTQFLKSFTEKVLGGFEHAGNFEVHYYRDFRDLIPIYEELSGDVKGIVASGSFPARMLEMAVPNARMPIRAFNNDNASVYKLFLGLINQNRALRVERVFADILDVTGLRAEEILFGSFDANFSDVTHNKVMGWTRDELENAEEIYTRKHVALWQAGRIDLSITRFSSIVGRLEKAGLPVRFAYPDISFVRRELLAALREITIRELTNNLNCSIAIAPRGRLPSADEIKALRHWVARFGAEMKLNFQTQRKTDGIEILTHKEAARTLTNGFAECRLHAFLDVNLGFEIAIGYGIGLSLYQARINAVDASRVAAGLPFPASALINEEDELIVPLLAEKKLVVPRHPTALVRRLSEATGLSRLTIQKILSVLGETPGQCLTSQALSYKLSITKRSANRFLSALVKAGVATVVEKKQGASRGRPEHVYRLETGEALL